MFNYNNQIKRHDDFTQSSTLFKTALKASLFTTLIPLVTKTDVVVSNIARLRRNTLLRSNKLYLLFTAYIL